MRYVIPQIGTIMTLLLIATSINSVHLSLQQDYQIQNMGNILIQDNLTETIFFEYGAESGALQPPWDSVSGDGIIEVDDTHVRTGTKSIYMYQIGPPNKGDQDRRNHLREYGSSHRKSEGYLSWWMYVSSQLLETQDSSRVTLGGWQLWFGPSGSTWIFWTGGRFRLMENKRFQYSYKWGDAYGWGYGDDAAAQQQESAIDYWAADYENQWVHFQIYWKIAESNGVCTFWFNNNMVANITGLHSDPRYYTTYWNNNPNLIAHGYDGQCEFRWSCDGNYPNIGPEIYQDEDSFENWVWFDDVVASTEKVSETYGVYS
jgi:hypothetical protein